MHFTNRLRNRLLGAFIHKTKRNIQVEKRELGVFFPYPVNISSVLAPNSRYLVLFFQLRNIKFPPAHVGCQLAFKYSEQAPFKGTS